MNDAQQAAIAAAAQAVQYLITVLGDEEQETSDRIEAARLLLDFAMKPIPGAT